MLQRRRYIIRRLHNLLDAFLTAAVFGLTYLLRNNLARFDPLEDLGSLLPFEYYAPLMLIATFLWPIILNYHGFYDPTRLRKAFVNVGIIFRSSMESTIILVTLIFLFRMEPTSRLFLLGFGLFNTLALVTKDLMRRQYNLHCHLRGKDIRPVLIVGTPDTAKQMIQKIKEESYLGLKPIGVVLPRGDVTLQTIDGTPVVGTLQNWRQILHENPVANVIVTIRRENMNEVEEALSICQEEGVDVWVQANLFDLNLPQVEVDYLATIPILVFRTTPVLSWAYIFKLLLDRLFAFTLLLLLSPVLLFISLAILVSSGWPIFYKQTRVGRFGQQFQLYKFRTLEMDRKTPIRLGLWLRNIGLDEFPQLLNILRGEMSFVGPRPHIPEEVKRYTEPWQRKRFSVAPGLTCYRQISKPQKIPFDEALALDLKYIEKWSLWADFFLIFKTVILLLKRVVVLRRKEA